MPVLPITTKEEVDGKDEGKVAAGSQEKQCVSEM